MMAWWSDELHELRANMASARAALESVRRDIDKIYPRAHNPNGPSRGHGRTELANFSICIPSTQASANTALA